MYLSKYEVNQTGINEYYNNLINGIKKEINKLEDELNGVTQELKSIRQGNNVFTKLRGKHSKEEISLEEKFTYLRNQISKKERLIQDYMYKKENFFTMEKQVLNNLKEFTMVRENIIKTNEDYD